MEKIITAHTGDWASPTRRMRHTHKGMGHQHHTRGLVIIVHTGRWSLKDFAKPFDLVVVRLVQEFIPLFDLLFHELAWIGVGSDIADREINTLFNDQLIAADIRHMDLVLPLVGVGAFIFSTDGVEKDIIGLFSKGKEAQL